MGKTMLDIGSQNPRIQCGECGRWMRLHGKRLQVVSGEIKEVAVQRFNGSCDVTMGDHPCGSEVCTTCCPSKCKATLSRHKEADHG